MTDVFISYKKEDVARVQPIAQALANAGYEVWWDHRIPAGRSYRDVIGAALQSAKCVIVVWSDLSANAQWVLDEADEGKRRNVLLPLLIDDVEIPYGFRQIEAARLVGWRGDTGDAEWANALASVAHFVGRPPGGPPKPLNAPSAIPDRPAPRRRRDEPRERSSGGFGPLLGFAALAAVVGGGGYYAWSSGMIGAPATIADDEASDEDADLGDIEAGGDESGGNVTNVADNRSGGANRPSGAAPAVLIPGDPMGTFFASGYQYCDAKLVSDFWGGYGIGESKLAVGNKILNGLASAVPEILQLSRNAGHRCEWIDTGYSYSDAEQLAQVWGLPQPYDAKLKVARLVTNGQRDIVERALGRA